MTFTLRSQAFCFFIRISIICHEISKLSVDPHQVVLCEGFVMFLCLVSLESVSMHMYTGSNIAIDSCLFHNWNGWPVIFKMSHTEGTFYKSHAVSLDADWWKCLNKYNKSTNTYLFNSYGFANFANSNCLLWRGYCLLFCNSLFPGEIRT